MAAAAALPFILGGAAVGIGSLVMRAVTQTKDKIQTAQALPQAPKPEDAQNKAAEIARKKRASMSQSVYTNPLGTAGEANIARKTLLGQ